MLIGYLTMLSLARQDYNIAHIHSFVQVVFSTGFFKVGVDPLALVLP